MIFSPSLVADKAILIPPAKPHLWFRAVMGGLSCREGMKGHKLCGAAAAGASQAPVTPQGMTLHTPKPLPNTFKQAGSQENTNKKVCLLHAIQRTKFCQCPQSGGPGRRVGDGMARGKSRL